jgi:pyruvate dehydrogenase E2 component (dihydrolipoamide acetyltransferase)
MEFRLPELGEGVSEGELIKWRVKEGEMVKDDQPLCEVMTDKATIEIPSPFSGKIKQLVAKEGEIVKVHQLMVVAEGASGAAPAAHAAPAVEAPRPAASVAAAVSSAAAPAPATKFSADVLASPATRKMARENGVDLGSVPASGPHGRVLMDDVARALSGASAPAPVKSSRVFAAGEVERTPIRGMRKKISEKMRLSKDKAAHFTYVEEADATELVRLRTQAKAIAEKQGIKLTYLPFILKAMVAALKQHPRLNSTLDEATNEIVTHHTYNISLSVQTEDGLTVPVVKHVEQKTIFELAREIADIVDRARKKKLVMEDFQGSTITLTNAGSIGGLFATPIINYPEVAILGFNKIFRKPVVVNRGGKEKLAIRDWTYFSISMDHRILDGAEAAEFMKTFISFIENPSLLVLG